MLPPGATSIGMAGCSPREREICRQLDRLMDVFPEARGLMKRLLDLTDPRISHSVEDELAAAQIAEALTTVLAFLSEAARDPRPPVTFRAGGPFGE